MAVPLDPAKVDDAIALYQSGKTADEVSDALGIGKTSVYRALERHGLRARPRLRELDTAAIVTRYLAGESELALSRAFGIDRNGIRRRLLEAGISPRGRSAAMFTRMANTSPEDRKKLAQPSHDALRGTKRPFSQKVRRALTREAQGIGISPVEAQFSAALADRGLHTLPQLAVGPYNIDIAAPPVAASGMNGTPDKTQVGALTSVPFEAPLAAAALLVAIVPPSSSNRQ